MFGGFHANEESLYVFLCVTCFSFKVWLYCLKFGGFLDEEKILYVFCCVTCISYICWSLTLAVIAIL